ncbi:cysteine desulfurase family protein [Auritidibacter ignavus]|uniref:cysteine desulfurase family protein n=1 Tax=Auritidibacter ignavus TaxID=678932 RepID=UPI0024B96FD6|nr:cysteine desulfurase family protein [Auritidibacter ignavus]WHS35891.1 cysteine desulfurase family protein [Auritidibacter ignavus]
MSIYLDYAASAPPRPEVLRSMWPYLTGAFANPAAQHEPAEEARGVLEAARQRLANHLGARPSEIIFTSGGTESDNTAVKGIALAQPRGQHVVVSAIEHPAVLESATWLQRFGYRVERLPVDATGQVSPAALEDTLREDTTLVSIQYASNEVGTVQDIPALAAVAQNYGVPFHTDAVQAAGDLPLQVDDLGVQAMSLAGHKLGTPKGIGALYLRRRTPCDPLIHGGGQQRGLRSGTENLAAAVGMVTGLELAQNESVDLRDLRDAFIHRVEAEIPGAQLTGHRHCRLPGHASFVFAGRSGESVLLDLQRYGIMCSAGSACAAGSQEPSPALIAMGYGADLAQTAVRFTFGAQTTPEQLDHTVDQLARLVIPTPNQ